MLKKRFFLSCLIIVMVVFMTSCQKDSSVSTTSQSGDENVTAPGELPIVKEKITLNIGMPDITEVIDFETNAYTKWLEEQTGVDLEFTLFPANASEARTKLDVMLASGTELQVRSEEHTSELQSH